MIAAAGSGERLGAGGPKALVEAAGRPLIAWSVDAISRAGSIGALVIAAPAGHEEEIAALADPATVVTGSSSSRSGSVANALSRVETELVVVHDAARPLASSAVFDLVVSVLVAQTKYAGVIAAEPVNDTLKRASQQDFRVSETLDRDELWAVQTPQAFRTPALRDALAVGEAALEQATDDAALVEAAGGLIRVQPVGDANLKVTSSADLEVASALLARRRY